MAQNRRLERVKGRVKKQKVLKGTASEHKGIVLTADDGETLRLQRIGGNPFEDPITQSLAGQEVSLEGFRLGKVFRFTRVCRTEDEKAGNTETKSRSPHRRKS